MPWKKFESVFTGKQQSSLFPNDHVRDLEAIRSSARGSAFANSVVDCAIDAVHRGMRGDAALRATLESACDAHIRSGFKSVEEHYLRKEGSPSALNVRERMESARKQTNLTELVATLTDPKLARGTRLPMQSGLDEGPPL